MKLASQIRAWPPMTIAACLIVLSFPHELRAQDAQERVTVNNVTRTYLVHLPEGYDQQQHYPVVILLHGLNQDPDQMARLTQFNELADKDSIIAVYPNALNGRWSIGLAAPAIYRGPYRRGPWGPRYPPPPPRQRRQGAGRPAADLEFFNQMLDKLSNKYSVDPARVYVAGLGEGGFMALRVGCNMGDRIAAIAAVAAALPKTMNCVALRPVAVLLMNGTNDPILPHGGGSYKDAPLKVLSAEDSAKYWARQNHCAEKPNQTKLPSLQKGFKDTKVYTYDNCQADAQVALYDVKDGGHTWPGGEQYMSEKEVGKTSLALNANETIWSFFVTKKISNASSDADH
ncbi:MAG TPA: PHB depolymerase family esterase [Candidatus Aquilonibacter sp.]|nr:PHB depolymerase family esterase [Candidatus Aquilonibacter sp.]